MFGVINCDRRLLEDPLKTLNFSFFLIFADLISTKIKGFSDYI